MSALKPPRVLAAINICNYCNNRCIYCKEGRREGAEYASLSLPEIKRNIARLVLEKKVEAVILMGGEVSLRPDFMEILRFIRSLGLEVGVGSNLVRFSDKKFLASCLKHISFLEVSVPAITEKEYRVITRSENFNKFMRGLRNVAAAKVPVTVNIVLTRYTLPLVPGILAFLDGVMPAGLRMVNFKIPTLRGNAQEHADKMCGPVLALRRLKPLLIEWSPRMLLMVTGAPLCLMRGFEQFSLEAFVRFAGHREICINHRTLVFGMDLPAREPFFAECNACRMKGFCAIPSERAGRSMFDNKLDAGKILGRLAGRLLLPGAPR
ncbi:MAG: hypothetical protein A2234_08580 [Elusimicrobia bacterium RIFOXYA2_FULL_58_8]|nr:MAG: hypothetical protein A2234_08580 [Elusimicrobia bacterium RIFOXYA2_FULL_58_8]